MSVNCQQSFVNLCYVIILLVQFLSVFSLLTRTVYLLTFTVCLTYIILLQWLNRGRVGYPQTSLTPPHFCACPKSGVQPIVCLVVFLLWLYMFYMFGVQKGIYFTALLLVIRGQFWTILWCGLPHRSLKTSGWPLVVYFSILGCCLFDIFPISIYFLSSK